MPQGNKTPSFSIIVPVYNVKNYLKQCIDSVLAQNFQDFELILVDDGSTDGSGEICDEYVKNQPHTSIVSQNSENVNTASAKLAIKAIHQPNSGLSAARNTGVAQASGEYLLFLDGDDYLEENALSTIYNALEPNLDLLRYQAQEVFADGKKLTYPEAGFATIPGVKAFAKLATYHYTENAWLYAYRRAFFVKNRFQYAEGCIAEDFGLTPLILARAEKVKAIPDICYNYRQRSDSIMHDPAKLAHRSADIISQLRKILPEIATIPHAEPILHYLVASFLTGATELTQTDFLQVYHEAKKEGILKYIRPSSLKSLPRAFLLKHLPRIFYQVYHR